MAWPPATTTTGSSAGPVVQPTRTVSSSQTVTASDATIRVDSSRGAINLALLPAAAVSGQRFTFKKITDDANAITVKAAGSEIIDDLNIVQLMSQYEAVSLQSNGTSYDVLFRG